MKELYILNNHALGILDADNYVVFDKTKPLYKDKGKDKASYKYSYHSTVEQAIRELCRLGANETCHDLKSWVGALQAGYMEVVEAVTASR